MRKREIAFMPEQPRTPSNSPDLIPMNTEGQKTRMVVMGLRMSKVARTDSRFPLALASGSPLLMITKHCETKSLPGVNRGNNSSGTVCLNILRREMRQQVKEFWVGVSCEADESLDTA